MCGNLSARRQTNGLDVNVINDHLSTISDVFTEAWLQREDGNPLQLLWCRRDFLATVELLNFGYGLKKARNINPTWVNDQVSAIRSANINRQRGSVYEIIAVGLFHQPPQHVVELPRAGQPGYDLIVRFQDDSKVYVSLKSYGRSHSNIEVIEQGKEIRDIIRSHYPHLAVRSLIIKNECYPTSAAWNILKSRARSLASTAPYDQPRGDDFDGWSLAIAPQIPDSGGIFWERRKSDSICMIVPFHMNEKMNLYSKLDDACANLNAHGETETFNSHNIVVIHIPEDVHIADCVSWAHTYFTQHPEKPISGVMFYQTGLVANPRLTTTSFTIAYQFVPKQLNGPSRWINTPTFGLNIQAGTILTQLPPFQLTDRTRSQPFPDRYVYQEGDCYYRYNLSDQMMVNLENIGGIKKHAVLVDGDREHIIKGIFPESRLLIS